MISVSGDARHRRRSLTRAACSSTTPPRSGASSGRGPVVVGRDARPSGPWVLDAVAGRRCCGVGARRDRRRRRADARDAGRGRASTARPAASSSPRATIRRRGTRSSSSGRRASSSTPRPRRAALGVGAPTRRHVGRRTSELGRGACGRRAPSTRRCARVLAPPGARARRAGRARRRSSVDGCARSAGSRRRGRCASSAARSIELDCEPDGRFTRGLEPLPENLGALGRGVREHAAPTSAWRTIPTPIAPRSWTTTACRSARSRRWRSPSESCWRARTGPVVDEPLDLPHGRGPGARRPACRSTARAVGEAHVVAGMTRCGGRDRRGGQRRRDRPRGPLRPGRHGGGRAGLPGLGRRGRGPRARPCSELPRYVMMKAQAGRRARLARAAARRARARVSTGFALDRTDGLRFARDARGCTCAPPGPSRSCG